MDTVIYKKDAQIYASGENMRELGLIVKGSVRQQTKESAMLLEAGNLIGLAGCSDCKYGADYYANEETTIYPFEYEKTEDLDEILTKQKEYGSVFILAALKQARKFFEEYDRMLQAANGIYDLSVNAIRIYKAICAKYYIPEHTFDRIDQIEKINGVQKIPNWKRDYYSQFCKFGLDDLKGLFTTRELCVGTIFQTGTVMSEVLQSIDELRAYILRHRGIVLQEDKNDLFHLIFDLEIKTALVGKGRDDVAILMEEVQHFMKQNAGIFSKELLVARIKEYEAYDFGEIPAEQGEAEATALASEPVGLENSLEHILRFAEETPENMIELRERITEYRGLSDPFSTDDEVRKIRKAITTAYYRVYKACVKRVFERGETTPIVQMFLHFGYMDAAVVGKENAEKLQQLMNRMSECKSKKVYTFYDWLQTIYKGEHEPSISELDMDYGAYLKDAVKNGEMSAADAEKNKTNSWMKVEYELNNLFQSLSKTINGKITTFCPILSEADIISTPDRMLVTAEMIETAIDNVRKIDFSIFYREVMFSDEEHGIPREYINKEVLPDVILFPLAGTRGMMWQVTEGVRNNTSARIILPILTANDVDDMIIENCGRYRWEMCRKIQGSRWNDVTTPSLTSLYNDYIQYYKKNSDLSTEAKEKIANALVRARSNYREVFVRDYENWIKFEAKSSFRLNKVAREILCAYCPFVAEIRETLKEHPMFADYIRRYEVGTARAIKRLEGLYQKYEKSGGELTEELKINMDYYSM